MAGTDIAAAPGRRIFFHSLLNLAGTGGPLLVAVVAIPFLIAGLGTERFGVLTLVWVLIGYLGLLDLGIGRALTKLIAERLGTPAEDEVPALIGTALLLMFGFGCLGALACAALSGWLASTVLAIPPPLQSEAAVAFLLVAAAIPAVTLTTGLRGVLEACHRFDLVNAVRAPMGIFTFAGPLLVLPFTDALPAVVVVLIGGRAVAALVHWRLVRRVVPGFAGRLVFERGLVGPLLRFGGWMTVSNLVSPLMVYFDRFLIGALLSVAAVAYYATPYEVVTKLWIVPGALLSVLFPTFAAGIRQQPERMAALFGRALFAVLAVIAPVTLILVTFGETVLAGWVGEEFARNSTVVLQWLAVGVLVNSLAQVPFTALQGAGRPDLTAKLHLAEVPFYLAALAWLTLRHGIEGAAVAWVVRVSVDALALFLLTARLLPASAVWIRRVAGVFPAVLLLTTAGVLAPTMAAKVGYVSAVLALGLLGGWLLLGRARTPALSGAVDVPGERVP